MNDDKIRTAFQRLDRDVRAAIRPGAGLERIGRRRWGRILLVPLGAAAVVALVVGAGALLLQGTEPPPAATTLPTDVTALTPTTLPGTVTTVPAPDPDWPEVQPTTVVEGEVLLASGAGVDVLRDGAPFRIVAEPARVAVSDRFGGILYESGGEIFRLRAGYRFPEVLMSPAELHDTAVVDGQPVVIYTRHEPVAGSDSVAGQVFYAPLDAPGGPVLLYAADGYEGAITRVSYGGGIFAITQAAEGIEWFEFVDAEGRPVEVANPRPFEADSQDDRYTDQGLLSADGRVLTFLQSRQSVLEVGDGIDVVQWDLASGEELQRTPVGLSGEAGAQTSFWFVRADSDGDRLLLGRLDAERNPLGPLELGLAEPSLVELPAPGAPSLAGPAAPPVSGVVEPGVAIIPAEGLGRGVVLANPPGVVWHPDPVDGAGPVAPITLWTVRDPSAVDGASAHGDGNGGVVFGGGSEPIQWLTPGADRPQVLLEAGSEFRTLFGVGDFGGAAAAWFTTFEDGAHHLWTVGLASGEVTLVSDALGGDGTLLQNVSFDGERFWVAVVDGLCPRTFTVGRDGSMGDAPAVPVSACDGPPHAWYEQARVSPDGRLVAYVAGTLASAQADVAYGLGFSGPLDLVVAHAETGDEIARVPVGTDVQNLILVHDFDGDRVLVSRTREEQGPVPHAVFAIDLASGRAGRLDSVAVEGGLTGPVVPAEQVAPLQPLPGCSADGAGFDSSGQVGLPAEVAETRAAIQSAVAGCDFDALDALALAGEFNYHFDVGFPGMFRQAENGGAPEVRRLGEILGQPYGTIESAGTSIYVWPKAATYDTWDQVPVDERNRLAFIYDAAAQQEFAGFGAYIGLRVGITADGDWLFVAEGD